MTLRQKRVPRRQRLIEIGLELFSTRSYDEVAIDDIADEAGIAKGLLYYYFPTKHDFYVAVVRSAAEQLLAMTNPDETLPPLERLRRGLTAYLTYVEQHADAYRALLRGGVGVDRQVAAIVDEVRTEYARRVCQGLLGGREPSPPVGVAVSGWVGFVEALSLAWLEQREIEKETLCELAVTALLAIVEKTPDGRQVLHSSVHEAD
ncbi:MAG TPA: TetR/AcrR family transcriptional regulator [Ktedonobacteraceae bacterium]|nr:TetR/AcrR family transcriptional regulator [Ktedonobacteraceae bacterium]